MTKIATLCLLIKDKEITLAKKKKKVGAGKYNGYGGKVENNMSIEETAVKEVFQETGGVIIKLENLEKVGVCYFFIDNEPVWFVHIFIARVWAGEPKETEEMGPPEKFNVDNIPYHEMLSGDQKWIPLILKGMKIRAVISYDKNNKLTFFSYSKTESIS